MLDRGADGGGEWDYRDLNNATPPIPVADMLVDAVAGHEIMSFMDGTAGYHQIPVDYSERIATRQRLGVLALLESLSGYALWAQERRSYISESYEPDLSRGKILEVYIDDVVLKSKQRGDHIRSERENAPSQAKDPAKCVFGG